MKTQSTKSTLWLMLAVMTFIAVSASAQPVRRLLRPDASQNSQSEPAAAAGAENSLSDRLNQSVSQDISGPATSQQVQALSNQVKALQSKVNQMSSQLQRQNIYCQSPSVSANGLGDTDQCAPYRCNTVSGRCREACRSVDDCASPYVCDTTDHCIEYHQ